MPDLKTSRQSSLQISLWAIVACLALLVHITVRTQQPVPGRIILFVIDDLNLDFRNTPRIRALVRKMGQQLVREGDLFGMVSTGPSSITINPTSDLMRLDDATRRLTGYGLRPVEIVQPSAAGEIERRARKACETMLDLLRRVQTTPASGRAVVLVSDGWDLDRAAEANFASELNEVVQLVSSTNATLYAVNPWGIAIDRAPAGGVDPNQWAAHVRREQDSMRSLVERTGGLAASSVDDYSKVVEQITGGRKP